MASAVFHKTATNAVTMYKNVDVIQLIQEEIIVAVRQMTVRQEITDI
ncbi:MAG: hypothetical protein NC225_09140 [Clostridium sp.]|nr:hypothetical protein [Clostridium sp.]MCM1399627.1 hypothetical protein [Clostridium sp.]MCM1460487.1 hypothetical protein [Bacteroides sp.]